MPAFATDVFGPKNAGTIYGAMLTAWSAGAIVGPLLIASVPYQTALPVIVCLLAAANVLPVVLNAFVQPSPARATTLGQGRSADQRHAARRRAAARPRVRISAVPGWTRRRVAA